MSNNNRDRRYTKNRPPPASKRELRLQAQLQEQKQKANLRLQKQKDRLTRKFNQQEQKLTARIEKFKKEKAVVRAIIEEDKQDRKERERKHRNEEYEKQNWIVEFTVNVTANSDGEVKYSYIRYARFPNLTQTQVERAFYDTFVPREMESHTYFHSITNPIFHVSERVRRLDLMSEYMYGVRPGGYKHTALQCEYNFSEDGRCVLQYLIDHFRPYFGRYMMTLTEEWLTNFFLEQRKRNETPKERQAKDVLRKFGINVPTEAFGVSPRDLQAFCKRFRIAMYAVDTAGYCFFRWHPNEEELKERKDLPPIMFVTDGKHLYPIEGKAPRMHLRACMMEHTAKKKPKQISTVTKSSWSNDRFTVIVDNLKDFADADKLALGRPMNVVLAQGNLEKFMIQKMLDTKTIYDPSCYTYSGSTLVHFSAPDGHNYFLQEHFDEVLLICQKLSIPFTSQPMPALCFQFIEKQMALSKPKEEKKPWDDSYSDSDEEEEEENDQKDEFTYTQFRDTIKLKSTLNPQVRQVFNEMDKRPFTEQFLEKSLFTEADLAAYDYKKCYSSILADPKREWMFFNAFDEFRETNAPIIPSAFYKVETENFFPLRHSGYYCGELLLYCQSQNIPFTVTHVIKPSKVKKGLYSTFVNKAYEILGNHAKFLINSFIGCQNKQSTTKLRSFFAEDLLTAGYLFFEKCHGNTGYAHKITEDLVHVTDSRNTPLVELNTPVYAQVIQLAWMKLHQLYTKIAIPGETKLVRLNTDCIIVAGPHKPFTDPKPLGGVQRVTENLHAKLIGIKSKHKEAPAVPVLPPWKPIDIDERNWKDPKFAFDAAQAILDSNKGCFLTGLAGTGKSYVALALIQLIEMKALQAEGNKLSGCVKMAFTNKAALLINGSTIHTTFRLGVGDSVANAHMGALHNKEYIIVDEISLVPSEFYTLLMRAKEMGCKIILVGDYCQLPPVEKADYEYRQSATLRDLVDNQILELKLNKRSDDRMFNLAHKVLNGEEYMHLLKVDNSKPSCDEVHIAYTNRLVERLNKMCMRDYLQKHPNQPVMTAEGLGLTKVGKTVIPKGNPDSKMHVSKGMPVICSKGNRKLGCFNNETFVVLEASKDHVLLKSDDRDDYEIRVDPRTFTLYFHLNFATTCHKAQGTTIRKRIRVWDTTFLHTTERWLYTAFTRTDNIEKLSISLLPFKDL